MVACAEGRLVIPAQPEPGPSSVLPESPRPGTQRATAVDASHELGSSSFDAGTEATKTLGPPCNEDDAPSKTVASRSDTGFSRRYREAVSTGRLADSVTVSLQFCGDFRPILALGFIPFSVDHERGWAAGVVNYLAAERLVQHPGVRWLAVGEEKQTDDDVWD